MVNVTDEKISAILKAADDKKAFNKRVLDITKLTAIADYFVILSGNNERQVLAIADGIEDKMEEEGYKLKNKEGYKTSRWVLLDYGDIVVHIFHKEDREFYNLERLWIDAKELKIEDIT
ncbi:ribosome silencing factor [Thermohalobacter berrensis]|uniref:Ribosomal silencing factor RsfS n=1 Tax=Thermohalobacter berrensis TaxID=99594 RepID=A0A419T4V7_9FIRM|nr:ribosome silencing factor [Thermohalobacter berrensis]RKD32482.1 ribosome silencing factor [Thermohalobacter berrensis]